MDPITLLIILLVVAVILVVTSRRGMVDLNLILTVAVICLLVWLVWAVSSGRV